MKLKFLCYLIVAGTLLISCSKDTSEITKENLNLQSSPNIQNENNIFHFAKGTEIDTAFVVSEANSGMILFVNKIRNYYENGFTYSELKNALDPETQLGNITPVGDDLLQKSYEYITYNTPEKDMTGYELVLALESIVQYNQDKGITKVKNIDLDEGSRILFGLPDSYLTPTPLSRKCKWYQVGCHLGNLWDWLTGNNGFDVGDVLHMLTMFSSLMALLD